MHIDNFSRVAKLVCERMQIQDVLQLPNPAESMLHGDARWPAKLTGVILAQAVPIAVAALNDRLAVINAELVELGMSID
ncbi:hypothetical protein [Blastomonas sp. AAP25]|uniref:hypothetical protein n=1 Tax=Blastomonas sp. AAP25 TaxID=1523416 RepID=UPI000B056516|nr:hypothetical protein [Blastomonas sp. AAP25]